jgi:hypothetical protein
MHMALTTFDVDENFHTGSITSGIGALTTLIYLDLDSNTLKDTFPNHYVITGCLLILTKRMSFSLVVTEIFNKQSLRVGIIVWIIDALYTPNINELFLLVFVCLIWCAFDVLSCEKK